MHRFIVAALVFVLAFAAGLERSGTGLPGVPSAEAQALGRSPGGARPQGRPHGTRTRPGISSPPYGSAQRPAHRPETLPAWRHDGRPGRPGARPPDGWPPIGTRPPGARPPSWDAPGGRPPAWGPPGWGHPGWGHPGWGPPGARPPIARPPGWRPPGWRPPLHRPPGWRPPFYRPPYPRPPHWRWGPWFWYPAWGWYFTAALGAGTLVYVATLPYERGCEEVRLEGETLILCDGVLYRPFRFQDETVFEIVSDASDGLSAPAAPAPGAPGSPPAPGAPSPSSRVDRDGFRWTD